MNERRRWLAAASLGLLSIHFPARAAFPDKPIRLVVTYAAGCGSDIVARHLGQKLAEQLGVPVVVENKPGAGTLIGGDFVARSAPDGYTLMIGTTSMAMLPLRKQGSPLDMRKDFTPISLLAESVFVVLANPDAPFGNLAEMIAYGRAQPGRLTYGINGTGTASHLAGEYFFSTAGIVATPVPYKGSGPQTVALLGGEIPLAIDGIGATNAHIKGGKLVLLATTGDARTSLFPDTPTVSEVLPGFVAKGFYGLVGPSAVPGDVAQRLNRAVKTVLDDPETRTRFATLSLVPVISTPEEYARQIVDDVAKWGDVVRKSNLVIE